jgi:hypothetical protein
MLLKHEQKPSRHQYYSLVETDSSFMWKTKILTVQRTLNTETEQWLRIRICMDPHYFEKLVSAPH